MSELVPQAVHDLLAFYTENCPEVRFGDLDVRVLERTVKSIDEAAERVVAAEDAMTQARAQFREVEAGLLVKTSRTLSFLKIFVEDDVEQLAKLEAIGGGLPSGRRKSRVAAGATTDTGEPRQRRTRKSKNAEETASGAQIRAGQAIEGVPLDKAGLTDDLLGEHEATEPAPVAAPVGRKSGSKSTK